MNINVETPIADMDGKPIVVADAVLTLRKICVDALLAQHPSEQPPRAEPDGTEKLRRFLLAKRISETANVEMTVEEVSLVKKLVGMAFNPLVSGQAWLMLDPPRDAQTGELAA